MADFYKDEDSLECSSKNRKWWNLTLASSSLNKWKLQIALSTVVSNPMTKTKTRADLICIIKMWLLKTFPRTTALQKCREEFFNKSNSKKVPKASSQIKDHHSLVSFRSRKLQGFFQNLRLWIAKVSNHFRKAMALLLLLLDKAKDLCNRQAKTKVALCNSNNRVSFSSHHLRARRNHSNNHSLMSRVSSHLPVFKQSNKRCKLNKTRRRHGVNQIIKSHQLKRLQVKWSRLGFLRWVSLSFRTIIKTKSNLKRIGTSQTSNLGRSLRNSLGNNWNSKPSLNQCLGRKKTKLKLAKKRFNLLRHHRTSLLDLLRQQLVYK